MNDCYYYTHYWPNGRLYVEGQLINNKKHGCWPSYHSNGKLHRKGYWNNGEACGLWQEYRSNGKPYSKEYWNDGKQRFYGETYYPSGINKDYYI